MVPTRQSDVMSTNLHTLSAIRLGLERDRVGTSCRFGLDAALADQLSSLGNEQLWQLVTHVGENSLFVPRADLVALLRLPVALAGAMAAVQAQANLTSTPLRM